MLQRFKLSTRIMFMGVMIVICFSLVFAWITPRIKSNMYDAKYEKTKHVVESVWGILDYYAKQAKYDCVFGSRFIDGSEVIDYPIHKLILNRLANLFIRILFQQRFNDFTNAFKLYRREVIAGLQPILSHHFNLTVELPLKALIRGYSFAVVPISWQNRKAGISKLNIREMGSRYLFIVLYCLIEKQLSRGDYRRRR